MNILRAHPLHAADRLHAFVADLTENDISIHVPPASVDFCTLIFVLSAMDPAKMPQVLINPLEHTFSTQEQRHADNPSMHACCNMPHHMQAVRNLARTCKPGSGKVLVRDYAEGDLAEARLAGAAKQKKLSDKFYVRGDGTRAYYFSEARMLFSFACPPPLHLIPDW